jgi:hypothetical protein
MSSPLIVPQHFTKKLMVNPSGPEALSFGINLRARSLDLLLCEVCVNGS